MKILISAYSFGAHCGSEPGAGWSSACILSERFDVTVLTASTFRSKNDVWQSTSGTCVTIHYFDLPGILNRMGKWGLGQRIHYYLWQIFAISRARKLVARDKIQLVHHVTFGCYWTPSCLAWSHVPFVWGPLGGGESTPRNFLKYLSSRDLCFELLRNFIRWIAQVDPLLKHTVRKSSICLATSPETSRRLVTIGCRRVEFMAQCFLAPSQFELLSSIPMPPNNPIRFLSIGRPVHWKGFELALRGFAQAGVTHAEYWLLANGPERPKLEALTQTLGITHQVKFIERQPSLDAVYTILGQCHVLLHPAYHEAFGNVVLEAMGAGRPVVCLDLGGPAQQVVDGTGFIVSSRSRAIAIDGIAGAIKTLAHDPLRIANMGEKARDHVSKTMLWEHALTRYQKLYDSILPENE